ncbi:sugar ABC transporter ATP-binding protein [Nocardioides sp. NPDC047086]|uniref:sugar ABC transporter ATP-binding protein n=1 Tax=Nocardioides sp. NPDC047086 TaxID=3154810 RepID=UPI0033F982B3
MVTTESPALLEARRLSKTYGGARALSGVSFELDRGEIHALLGENGAGKSTLIKIISGSVRADEGTVRLDGRELVGLTPTNALAEGIGTVHQELSLIPPLSVADNIHLGQERVRAGRILDKKVMLREAREALERVGLRIDPRRKVAGLSRAEMQLIEIARVLYHRSPVLILDEPTASLSHGEAEELFRILVELRAQGIGIVYISHRLAEIRALADRVTVLRDGELVDTLRLADVSDQRLVELMAGRSLDKLFPHIAAQPGPTRLRVKEATSDCLQEASIEVRAGEVVGIAGLVGGGKSELGRACFGLERLDRGSIEIDGVRLMKPSPRKAMEQGLMYYPPDRKSEGLVPTATLAESLALGPVVTGSVTRYGFLSRRKVEEYNAQAVQALRIKPANLKLGIRWFSGGNQQKALLGRSFAADFGVHVFDEPTVGIDIGAKVDVYEHMKKLVEAGKAVLLISSDTEELLGVAHRIYVVSEGRIVADLRGEERTESNVVNAFFGTSRPQEAAGGDYVDRSA